MWTRNAMCAAVFVGACWLSLTTKAQEMPPATAAPKSHRRPMMRKFSYNCGGDVKVMVFLREHNVRVVFAGKSYSMKQVETASGTKYSDGTTTWWSKGEEGFLQDESKQGEPTRLADNCKLEKAANAASAGVVSGPHRLAFLRLSFQESFVALAPPNHCAIRIFCSRCHFHLFHRI